MPTVLVVDDSSLDRHLAASLLGRRAGAEVSGQPARFRVLSASNGQEALAAIRQETPDLVLTDLQMPDMDGLKLVQEIRYHFPFLPVVLMTGQGSEDIAIQALQRGAASYVPKKNLAYDLVETVEDVLAVAGAKKHQQRLLDECWAQSESQFVLSNDITFIPPLIGHFQENLTRMRLVDENGLIRVAVALREALTNAIFHGNLEAVLAPHARDDVAYRRLIEERLHQEPYEDRRVYVTARESRREAIYIIRDEGPGYDPAALPDPADPVNLEKVSGRGLLLIRTFMDEVMHNKQGNEIIMVKRCDR
ncbi:MAG TPA: response regulator [Gemmataceae bacterium]|jgi:CheY-like chemotaxis protein|nr:response regulator [Gemmataceae bacterium]